MTGSAVPSASVPGGPGRLYVDSADLTRVLPLLATGAFSGVTTNPTLLRRAGCRRSELSRLVVELVQAGAGRVFLQAGGGDAATLVADGRDLRALDPRVVVKVPATRAGVTAAAELARQDVPVLLTAVYHPAQALLAVQVGASFIAPYLGRMTDAGRDGSSAVAAIQDIVAGTGVTVLVASLRSLSDVASLAAAGVTAFALNPALADSLLADELTEVAAADFERERLD